MPTNIRSSQLAKTDTVALIAQYDGAISTPGRRYAANGRTPLQRRINTIVDLLSERADDGDAVALAWFAKTED